MAADRPSKCKKVLNTGVHAPLRNRPISGSVRGEDPQTRSASRAARDHGDASSGIRPDSPRGIALSRIVAISTISSAAKSRLAMCL